MKNIIPLFVVLTVAGTGAIFGQNHTDVTTAKAVRNLDKRVKTLEARMGRNVTTPTATNNLERRIDDLEDRIKDLEKQVKDLEKLERRVRDLERKK